MAAWTCMKVSGPRRREGAELAGGWRHSARVVEAQTGDRDRDREGARRAIGKSIVVPAKRMLLSWIRMVCAV